MEDPEGEAMYLTLKKGGKYVYYKQRKILNKGSYKLDSQDDQKRMYILDGMKQPVKVLIIGKRLYLIRDKNTLILKRFSKSIEYVNVKME